MALDRLEAAFPSLRGKAITLSAEDFGHNCLAYALGDLGNWWEPPAGGGNYWPPGFSPDITLKTVESIIRTHGFTVECATTDTPNSDAIAIYGEHDDWTHFAKFENGIWSSKLGQSHDVERIELSDLEIPEYGRCVKILCRPEK
jgi:hypothetical protein